MFGFPGKERVWDGAAKRRRSVRCGDSRKSVATDGTCPLSREPCLEWRTWESRPSMMIMRKKSTAQNGEKGNWSVADGYAKKARPGPAWGCVWCDENDESSRRFSRPIESNANEDGRRRRIAGKGRKESRSVDGKSARCLEVLSQNSLACHLSRPIRRAGGHLGDVSDESRRT